MSYTESLKSELGLLPKTNWTWFRINFPAAEAGVEQYGAWYCNGHVAMSRPPCKWPAVKPLVISADIHRPHISSRAALFYDIPMGADPILKMFEGWRDYNPLTVREKTERVVEQKRANIPYKPGLTLLEIQDKDFPISQKIFGIIALKRHYHSLVMRKFTQAEMWARPSERIVRNGQETYTANPVVFVVDELPVAVIMPTRRP